MPLAVYPLPFFAPHNPLTWVQIAYVIVKDYFYPRQAHPQKLYQGYFSAATRSIHVTDSATIRALWEMGFYGKGSLSRSEPTWLESERRRVGLLAAETSQEITEKRRKERAEFKRERARLEREAIEEQKRRESRHGDGGLVTPPPEPTGPAQISSQELKAAQSHDNTALSNIAQTPPNEIMDNSLVEEPAEESLEPQNQEHLQLSCAEAFFLAYSLGALSIIDSSTNAPIKSTSTLLRLFRQHSYFPPIEAINELKPDDTFLLHYIVYHHFRSLGWVVRDGIKFAVDYLLYQKGPVFTHATFAIMVIPSYTHEYWGVTEERRRMVERQRRKYSWSWLHCVNRVQGQVVKTLVLVYVDVPPPSSLDKSEDGDRDGEDVGRLLRRYKVREFCVQRWSMNRNRD